MQIQMVMDDFLQRKLKSISRIFEELTERLADPDISQDRKQMLDISRERASIEATVVAYEEWATLNSEKKGLVEMDEAGGAEDAEMREMIRGEIKEIEERQDKLEASIVVMLLPKDPNDDRNVMLEIRAGTGGDEASIFAGDLIGIYKKYCETAHLRHYLYTDSTTA